MNGVVKALAVTFALPIAQMTVGLGCSSVLPQNQCDFAMSGLNLGSQIFATVIGLNMMKDAVQGFQNTIPKPKIVVRPNSEGVRKAYRVKPTWAQKAAASVKNSWWGITFHQGYRIQELSSITKKAVEIGTFIGKMACTPL